MQRSSLGPPVSPGSGCPVSVSLASAVSLTVASSSVFSSLLVAGSCAPGPVLVAVHAMSRLGSSQEAGRSGILGTPGWQEHTGGRPPKTTDVVQRLDACPPSAACRTHARPVSTAGPGVECRRPGCPPSRHSPIPGRPCLLGWAPRRPARSRSCGSSCGERPPSRHTTGAEGRQSTPSVGRGRRPAT